MAGDVIMMSPKKFSEISGIGEHTVRRLCHVSDFPAVQAGSRWLIHADRAKDWLANLAIKPSVNLLS